MDQSVVTGRMSPDVVGWQAVQGGGRQRRDLRVGPDVAVERLADRDKLLLERPYPRPRLIVPVYAGPPELAQRLVEVVARSGVLVGDVERGESPVDVGIHREVGHDLRYRLLGGVRRVAHRGGGWDFAIRPASAPTFVNSAAASSNRSSNPIAASPVRPWLGVRGNEPRDAVASVRDRRLGGAGQVVGVGGGELSRIGRPTGQFGFGRQQVGRRGVLGHAVIASVGGGFVLRIVAGRVRAGAAPARRSRVRPGHDIASGRSAT